MHKSKPSVTARPLSDVLHNHLSDNGASPDLPKPTHKVVKKPAPKRKPSPRKTSKKANDDDDDMVDEQTDSSDLDMGFHQEKQAAAASGLLDRMMGGDSGPLQAQNAGAKSLLDNMMGDV